MKWIIFVTTVTCLVILSSCSLVDPAALNLVATDDKTITVTNGAVWQFTDGNQTENHGPSFKLGDTYYSYGGDGGSGGGGFKGFYVYTSKDMVNWTKGNMVLSPTSDPELYSCKIEALNTMYNDSTKKYIFWMHYENASNYNLGRMAVAVSDSPEGPFKLARGSFQPMGTRGDGSYGACEARDLGSFKDDDGTGYLVTASDGNANLMIFKLTSDYLNVASQVGIIYYGKHREAPSLIKVGKYYYLFTSEAAGWMPSKGMYSSALDIAGPWSDLRPIADKSSFSCQSGGVITIQGTETTSRLISYNRWRNGTMVWAPLTLDGPNASVAYYDNLAVNFHTGKVEGITDGTLLSENKTATSSSTNTITNPPSNANDGNYDTEWVATNNSWTPTPWWAVDLGAIHDLRNVQISWWIINGSEGYYKYRIETSIDDSSNSTAFNATYTTAIDQSAPVTPYIYGFSSDTLPANTWGRFVRITMLSAVPWNNPTNNWYTPRLWEVKVYGH